MATATATASTTKKRGRPPKSAKSVTASKIKKRVPLIPITKSLAANLISALGIQDGAYEIEEAGRVVTVQNTFTDLSSGAAGFLADLDDYFSYYSILGHVDAPRLMALLDKICESRPAFALDILCFIFSEICERGHSESMPLISNLNAMTSEFNKCSDKFKLTVAKPFEAAIVNSSELTMHYALAIATLDVAVRKFGSFDKYFNEYLGKLIRINLSGNGVQYDCVARFFKHLNESAWSTEASKLLKDTLLNMDIYGGGSNANLSIALAYASAFNLGGLAINGSRARVPQTIAHTCLLYSNTYARPSKELLNSMCTIKVDNKTLLEWSVNLSPYCLATNEALKFIGNVISGVGVFAINKPIDGSDELLYITIFKMLASVEQGRWFTTPILSNLISTVALFMSNILPPDKIKKLVATVKSPECKRLFNNEFKLRSNIVCSGFSIGDTQVIFKKHNWMEA